MGKTRKKKKGIASAINKALLQDMLFSHRVERDRSKYTRKTKHRKQYED